MRNITIQRRHRKSTSEAAPSVRRWRWETGEAKGVPRERRVVKVIHRTAKKISQKRDTGLMRRGLCLRVATGQGRRQQPHYGRLNSQCEVRC